MPIEMIQPSDYTNVHTSLPRIVWAPETEDMHINLVNLHGSEEIGMHTNQALDVVITCLNGSGRVMVDDDEISMQAGTIVVIPKGTRRHIVASAEGLQYTTCHRKRGGIIPTSSSRR